MISELRISSKIHIKLGTLPLGRFSNIVRYQDKILATCNLFYLKREGKRLFYAKTIVDPCVSVEYSEGSLIFDDASENKRYILIPHLRNDVVLKKYGIVQQAEFSVLEFRNRLLWNIWLIDQNLRIARKVKKTDFKSPKKPRILMEPLVILYQMNLYIKGLREQGYTADHMVYSCEDAKWLMDEPPTFDLELADADTQIKRTRSIEFFLYALENYDIFHIHSNSSLLIWEKYWDQNADLYFLKRMGKKIVSSFWGFCAVGCKTKIRSEECKICVKLKPMRCKSVDYTRITDRTFQYSDRMLSGGRICAAFPQIEWIDNPLDIDMWKSCPLEEIPKEFKLPETEKIRIYHSFGNSDRRDDVKGSKYIKRAIERLQSEGYPIEILLFDKVKHKYLKYYQMQADLVVDQLCAGWHGSTGVEAMAVGKPVITSVAESVKACLPDGRAYPFLAADKDTIYEVLKDCLDHPEKMKEIGIASREYAVRYHDYRIVTKQLDQVYRKIWNQTAEEAKEEQNIGNT